METWSEYYIFKFSGLQASSPYATGRSLQPVI